VSRKREAELCSVSWLTTSKENVWTLMARSLAGVMTNKPSACVKVGVMPFSGAGTSVDAVVDISASRRVPVSPDRVILGGVVRERENAGDDSDPYLQPATSWIEVSRLTLMVLDEHGQCADCSANADEITRGSILITPPNVPTILLESLAANVDGFSNVMDWAAFSVGRFSTVKA